MKSSRAKVEMHTQLMGTLIALCVFLLALVWFVETPALLRYGVSGLVLIMLLGHFFLSWLRNRRTGMHRRKQAAEYSRISHRR